MEFLKNVLSTELYTQLKETLKGKEIKLADISKGAYVSREKLEVAETQCKDIQKTLDLANETINGYKTMDIEGIKTSAADWETKYKAATALSKKVETDLKLKYAIDTALLSKGARSTAAAKALLNMDNVKLDGEAVIGLTDQLETITKEHDYLFTPKQAGSSGFEGSTPPGQETDYVSRLKKAREDGNMAEALRIKDEAFEKEKIVLT